MSQHTQIHYWSAPHFREGIKIRYRSARHSQTSHSKKDTAKMVIKQNLSKMTTTTQILITVLCTACSVVVTANTVWYDFSLLKETRRIQNVLYDTWSFPVRNSAQLVDDWLNSLTRKFAAYISQPPHNLLSRRCKHKCLLCLHNFIRLALCTCRF